MSSYLLDGDGYAMVEFYDYVNDFGLLYNQPIPGLYYFPVSGDKILESKIKNTYLSSVKTKIQWESVGTGANSRQVVHYGYKYNYKTGNTSEPAPPMPPNIEALRKSAWSLLNEVNMKKAPLDQCIINKYEPGQGINAHTDHKNYGDVICCYTIGSGASMIFTNLKTKKTIELYVHPGSWYIMMGEARWEWKHEMKSRKTDILKGVKIPRKTRISITFRSIGSCKEDREPKVL